MQILSQAMRGRMEGAETRRIPLEQRCSAHERRRPCNKGQEIVPSSGETRSAEDKEPQRKTLDMEQALCQNQASSAGARGTARSSGGLESWIASTDHGGNGQRATTTNAGSTIGFSSGVVTAPTDGASGGTLTQTIFERMLGDVWSDGADPRVVLVNRTYKGVIDTLTSQATRTVDVDAATEIPILAAANVYVSDYGKHTIVLSRYVRDTVPGVVLAIDPDYCATAFLRRPFMEPLAKTGDGEKRQILAEFCLVARNPDALGKVAGLT